jgi:hypothetical protein
MEKALRDIFQNDFFLLVLINTTKLPLPNEKVTAYRTVGVLRLCES